MTQELRPVVHTLEGSTRALWEKSKTRLDRPDHNKLIAKIGSSSPESFLDLLHFNLIKSLKTL